MKRRHVFPRGGARASLTPGYLLKPLAGEWRLLKTSPTPIGDGPADIAFGPVPEQMTRSAQARIFVFDPFDRAGFASPRSCGHLIPGQGLE